MKTAISISDSLFREADKTAKELGLSRSGLFVQAIEEYLNNHKPLQVMEKLNEVYSQESNGMDSDLEDMQANTLRKVDW